jgi:Nicotianamine synthase protein
MLQLQQICSRGECNLEKHLAHKIVSTSQCQNGMATLSYFSSLSPLPRQPQQPTPGVKSLLTTFPYYSSYVDLTQIGLSAPTSASPQTPRSCFAFLDCGLLPLASLWILSSTITTSRIVWDWRCWECTIRDYVSDYNEGSSLHRLQYSNRARWERWYFILVLALRAVIAFACVSLVL